MNRLSTAKRAQIVAALVEGNSLRSVTRMTGAGIKTATKRLVSLGAACAAFHYEHVRNVKAKRIEADEIRTFCYAGRENVPEDNKGEFGYGDVWTWVGLDPDSKLVLSWTVGRRNAETGTSSCTISLTALRIACSSRRTACTRISSRSTRRSATTSTMRGW